jgi:hypothetical protein
MAMEREENRARRVKVMETNHQSYASYLVLKNWIMATLNVCVLAEQTIRNLPTDTRDSILYLQRVLSRTCSFLLRIHKLLIVVAQKGGFPSLSLTSAHQHLTSLLLKDKDKGDKRSIRDAQGRTTATYGLDTVETKGMKTGEYWKRWFAQDHTVEEIQSSLLEKLSKILVSVMPQGVSKDEMESLVQRIQHKKKLSMMDRRLLTGFIKNPSEDKWKQLLSKI